MVNNGGVATALSVTATNVVGYQWYSNTNATNSGGTLLTGATSSTYTPLTTSLGTLYYYCVLTNTSSCSRTSNVSGAITINPLTAIGSQSTAGQTLCINGTFTSISVAATGTGTLSYQWYKNGTASTSGGTTVGTNSNSYTPSASVAGTLYYYCVATSTCGTATSAVSGAFIVNPQPSPVIVGSPNNTGDVNAGDIVLYCVDYTPGNIYYWSGFGELTFPNPNQQSCISDRFYSSCGDYIPWTITVREVVPGTGCSATVTRNINIH